jgi:Holliday junction DNA helicase RuvA
MRGVPRGHAVVTRFCLFLPVYIFSTFMIAYLKGKLVHKEPTLVIIDVNGIGYQVTISLHTFAAVKDQEAIQLATHLQVREDAHILYGFATPAEKIMFQHLISVNGVGPSTAMMVLSYMPPAELREAILRDDVAALQSVKGIGGKTAQRLVLELKNKLRKDGADVNVPASAHNTLRSEALSALMTLGIAKAAAEKSIDALLKKAGNNISLEELVKQALKNA